MVTNVATALIGLGDMWIVGRLDDAALQGAVDIGARLFAILFTVMNFLKTGTTGLVAQSGSRAGSRAGTLGQIEILLRGLFVGLTIAAVLLLLKPVLLPMLLSALGAQGDVAIAAETYASIRYWSAPGVMCNLALIGFLVGRRQMRAVLLIEVAYNLLNVGLGLWFVLELDWGIAGIGWSSLIAEYAKLFVVVIFLARDPAFANLRGSFQGKALFGWSALRPFLTVNRDLFLRTIILMLALAALTRLSAEQGAAVLAANGIIYQLFVLTALLLDGFRECGASSQWRTVRRKRQGRLCEICRRDHCARIGRGGSGQHRLCPCFTRDHRQLCCDARGATCRQRRVGLAYSLPDRWGYRVHLRWHIRRSQLDPRIAAFDGGRKRGLRPQPVADMADGEPRIVAVIHDLPANSRCFASHYAAQIDPAQLPASHALIAPLSRRLCPVVRQEAGLEPLHWQEFRPPASTPRHSVAIGRDQSCPAYRRAYGADRNSVSHPAANR